MSNIKMVGVKEAITTLGIHKTTLYKMADQGLIDIVRTPGGKRLFNITKYIKDNGLDKEQLVRRKVCYCRVSTTKQKDDLENQVNFLSEKYPSYEMIKDYGSGINYKRPGFLLLLKYIVNGELDEVVITYKDRLCRFGFELIEHLVKVCSKGSIIIENKEDTSVEEEIVNDLIQVVTVYATRVHGLRSYTKKLKKLKNDTKQSETVVI